MKKYIELIKNLGILAIGNMGSKLIVFLLVPLYTAYLSTAEYGEYDFIITTINLLIPILSLNITEAIIIYCLDKKYEKDEILKIGLYYLYISIPIVMLLGIINHFIGSFIILDKYFLYFIILYIINCLYGILSAYIRGCEKLKLLALSGILSTLIIVLLNVIFLVWLNWGIDGYFIANIFGNVIPCIYIVYMMKINLFKISKIDKVLNIKMKKYSSPLVLNSLSWWINNALDRYIVIAICGEAINGLYAIAYKLPTIINVFQGIFNQSWQISAANEINNRKSVFFDNVYNTYNIFMVFLSSIIILTTKIISSVLFSNDFYNAWIYVPFLIIASLFGALSGYIGGIFSAKKDSKIFAISTVIGAIVNIIGNIIFVNLIGAIGAAIMTCFSYFIIWIIRMINLKKYIKLNINIKKHMFSYILLIIQAVIVISEIKYYFLINICIFLLIVSIYYFDIKKMIKMDKS